MSRVTVRVGEKVIDCGDLCFDPANTCLIQFYKKRNDEPREPNLGISEESCVSFLGDLS